jgi:hypothetical protein
MNERVANIGTEVASLERKADQACTIHAGLRDKYERRANWLDYTLMAAATYLLALSFVEPTLGVSLAFGWPTSIVVPVLSIVMFFLSIVQFKNPWKSKAQDHHTSFVEYANVKKECRMITSGTRPASGPELQRIRALYDAATEKGTDIPEKAFVQGKARHVRKVYISRYLDTHPGASVWLVALKLFLRDNLGLNLLPNDDARAKDNPRP